MPDDHSTEESRAVPSAPAPPAASSATSLESPPEISPEKLDPEAMKVLRHLRRNGHQAYLVGGCVRDLLLGLTPKDFDIATSASPEQVQDTFRNSRLIGRRFRLAHVYFKGRKIIEVSTFRKNPIDELASQDASEPSPEGDLLISEDNVFGIAEEDARRRDFTVNGLFFDIGLGQAIDYVGGRADLEARIIRTIGNAEVRMREDPVRVLRAIRFAAKLGFEIEPGTAEAMRAHAKDLSRCAPARVLEETLRLLRCGHSSRAFQLLREMGLLGLLLRPVADFLDACGPEETARLFGLLAAADRRVRTGTPTDDSLLLAALLLRLAHPAKDSGAPAIAVEPLLSDLVHTYRLPKRISEGTRLLLLAQRALFGEQRRRGSPNRFVRSPHFAEALALFEMNAEVSGEGKEQLDRWRERQQAHEPARLPTAAPTSPETLRAPLADPSRLVAVPAGGDFAFSHLL
ncbi:MAG: CCA tRNA nucleotidyltransferase [Deltaproteobacteria bacterium]